MNYKYSGKEYTLKLNDDGQIECSDLGVSAPTVDEAKKLIREQVEKDKAAPRFPILILGERRGSDVPVYFEGTSTLKNVGRVYYRQVWISYKDDKGKVCRTKETASYVYEDTPENRERLDRYIQLRQQAIDLNTQAQDIKQECTTIHTLDE